MNDAYNRVYTNQPEYDKQFWNSMKGLTYASEHLEKGRAAATGTYMLPTTTENKYENEIKKASVFRNLASVFTRYNGTVEIIMANSDDISEYVQENESINIKDIIDDFSVIKVGGL